MKVLFIVPAIGYYRSGFATPLGVLSIATYLKANGHEVRVFDRNVEELSAAKIIKSFNPDIVGVSLFSSRCLKDALRVSKTVKRDFGKTLVWGGQLPSMYTELCLRDCADIDYISYGEGELTWLELVTKLEANESPDGIDGLAYIRDGKIIQTAPREFADLSVLPIIDWTLAKPESYYRSYLQTDKMLHLFSSKGCPFNCTFCASCEYHRHTHRQRPTDKTIEEIEYLVKNHDLGGIDFTNELWCLRKEDAHEFCNKLIEKKYDFIWGCDSRIGQYDKEDIELMYKANCRWMFFGVESGSPSTLKKVKKGINVDKVIETINNCIDVGITPLTSFIVGFPGETVEELKETVNLIMQIPIKLVPAYHYSPIPNSQLYRELVAAGKYTPPKSLKKAAKLIDTEVLGKNYSEIPSKDLRVVRCFFHWIGFASKESINRGSAFEFAKQSIADVFRTITKRGLKYFVKGVFGAAYDFLYVFWHVTMYPGVRKKYGLYLKNKK